MSTVMSTAAAAAMATATAPTRVPVAASAPGPRMRARGLAASVAARRQGPKAAQAPAPAAPASTRRPAPGSQCAHPCPPSPSPPLRPSARSASAFGHRRARPCYPLAATRSPSRPTKSARSAGTATQKAFFAQARPRPRPAACPRRTEAARTDRPWARAGSSCRGAGPTARASQAAATATAAGGGTSLGHPTRQLMMQAEAKPLPLLQQLQRRLQLWPPRSPTSAAAALGATPPRLTTAATASGPSRTRTWPPSSVRGQRSPPRLGQLAARRRRRLAPRPPPARARGWRRARLTTRPRGQQVPLAARAAPPLWTTTARALPRPGQAALPSRGASPRGAGLPRTRGSTLAATPARCCRTGGTAPARRWDRRMARGRGQTQRTQRTPRSGPAPADLRSGRFGSYRQRRPRLLAQRRPEPRRRVDRRAWAGQRRGKLLAGERDAPCPPEPRPLPLLPRQCITRSPGGSAASSPCAWKGETAAEGSLGPRRQRHKAATARTRRCPPRPPLRATGSVPEAGCTCPSGAAGSRWTRARRTRRGTRTTPSQTWRTRKRRQ
mmetsp:Transcript_4551/g.19367  ORF Transcript_4551/g.19367 Transcript_4551/m.19367 type:complete len:553 (+) Transcript_4551:110-1768(+)